MIILGTIETGNAESIYSIEHFQVTNQHYLGSIGNGNHLELWKTSYDKDRNLLIGKSIIL